MPDQQPDDGNSGVLPDGSNPQQGVLSSMAPTQWTPDWVNQQLATNLAYWNERNPGGGDPFGPMNGAPGEGTGKLAPWYNPANWGPPPVPTGPQAATQGWFPQEFNARDNGKFWTQAAYLGQFPGGAAAFNQQEPNTLNWRMLGSEPGNFMIMGHPISQNKLRYDLHRPVDTQEGAGVPGGSFLPYHGFGIGSSGWSTKGQVGFPGQLDPFGTSWGAGGP